MPDALRKAQKLIQQGEKAKFSREKILFASEALDFLRCIIPILEKNSQKQVSFSEEHIRAIYKLLTSIRPSTIAADKFKYYIHDQEAFEQAFEVFYNSFGPVEEITL